MAFVPHKYGNVVVGLQSAIDVEAAGTLYKIPLPRGCKPPSLRPNITSWEYSGGHYGLKWYASGGAIVEGSLEMPLIPGYVAAGGSGTDLGDWMFGRQNSAAYYEGYYATIYVDRGNSVVEHYLNCKVKSGRIKVDYGAPYASVELDIIGCSIPAADTFTDPDPDLFEIQPYRYDEASLSLASAADTYTRNHSIEFDNMIEAVEAINGTSVPTALPSGAKAQWKVSFDRWFYNSTIYDAFVASTEVAYVLTLARAGVATATFTMPRCVATEYAMDFPESGMVKETGITLQAYESTDGTVDACTVAEA